MRAPMVVNRRAKLGVVIVTSAQHDHAMQQGARDHRGDAGALDIQPSNAE